MAAIHAAEYLTRKPNARRHGSKPNVQPRKPKKMKREFEWDQNKNKIKHKISFENAKDVFEDENRLQYALDANGERRYLTIGKVFKVIILVVYTIRNFAFRFISARPARKDKRENFLQIV